MDVFKSKIDKSIVFCLVLSIVACLLGTSVMLKIGGTTNHAIATAILIFGIGFPLWITLTTRYAVNDQDLKITSGPFSWTIPIDSVQSIKETQSAITSPALSFDRLEIIYGEDKAILVSPADKTKFITKLGSEKLIGSGRKKRSQANEKMTKSEKKQQKKQRNQKSD
ncbi:MAG: PH domain-containing protein [Nitrosomonas sp.]|nr:PH domain-containing protein [Nitrosomonas sp.]